MISIGLIEDQQLVREGLARLIKLNPDNQLEWDAHNGEEALTWLEHRPVNIIISDIRMPVMDGIKFVTALREKGNVTPVLILTTFDDHQLFIAAIKAGINGFLLKDVSLEKLNDAIKTVAAGGFLAEPTFLKRDSEIALTASFAERPSTEVLSNKDLQILRYIAAGFSNKEIAGAVFLAEGTVKNRISEILLKLNCRDRTQAVFKALHWELL